MAQGCNVSNFSGWEQEEFNLNLMRSKRRSQHFGITLKDGRIIGQLRPDRSQSLVELWEVAKRVTSLDFDICAQAKEAQMFLDSEQVPLPPEEFSVSFYGEETALSVIMDFAQQCFLASESVSPGSNEPQMRCGMSVLLPIVSCWCCFASDLSSS